MTKPRSKIRTDLVAWAGLILGTIGTVVALLSYLAAREDTERTREIQAKQYFYEAMDLLGAEPGQHGLSVWLSENTKINRDRLEVARRLIEKYSVLNPRDANAALLRLLYYIHSNNLEGAKTELKEMQKVSGSMSDSDLYLFTAMILANRFSKPKLATAFFEQAIKEDHNNDAAYGMFAIFLHTLGRNQQSVEMFKEAIRLSPGDVAHRNGLAHVLFEAGDHTEAERVLKDAIAKRIGDGTTYNGLATIYAQLGKYEPAIEYFQKAIGESPTNPIFHHNLGLLYEKLNRKEDAQMQFSKAMEYWNLPVDIKEYETHFPRNLGATGAGTGDAVSPADRTPDSTPATAPSS